MNRFYEQLGRFLRKQETKMLLYGLVAGIVLAALVYIASDISRQRRQLQASAKYEQEMHISESMNATNNNWVDNTEATQSPTAVLLDLPLLESTFHSRYVGTQADKLGNTYDNALYYGEGYHDDVDIYVLSREFATLTGTVFVPEDRGRFNDQDMRIIIYGDDKRIYTSPLMHSTSYPAEFEIDVRGVDQIKIYYRGDDSIGLANLTVTRSSNPADKSYVSNVPMRLLDVLEIENTFRFIDWFVVADKYGNEYHDCVYYMFGGEDDRAVYLLKGEYERLSGTIFVPLDRTHEEWHQDEMYSVKIYGDNRLLYTSPHMLNDTAPVPFEIDVSGVQQLKITYYGGASTWYMEIGLADLFLR